jgi:type II secretory pathway pseudopilin PulG
LRRLVKSEGGFGLVELLIAMTVMVIAITAIVAGFSSGMVAINRASHVSTAGALADIQMEGFHKVSYGAIAPTCGSGASWSADCPSSVNKTGPEGRIYRIDTSVRFDCALGSLDSGTLPSLPMATSCGAGQPRPVKRVTVVVYDPSTSPATELFRETSTFDQATG